MDVAHGVALDDALVVHGDEELYLIHVAVRGHRQDVAALALVDIVYLRVGAGVLDLLELAPAGEEVGDHVVELLLGIGLGRAGQGAVRRKEHHGAYQQHGDGYKQFLTHFPAPPFPTPKRFTGTALSSAQAQAFMMRMA